MHAFGHLGDEREEVGSLGRHGDPAVVNFTDFAERRDQRDKPAARLFRLVHHLPLAVAERHLRIALQHAEIAADHAGRGPELVNGEGNQVRIRLFRRHD